MTSVTPAISAATNTMGGILPVGGDTMTMRLQPTITAGMAVIKTELGYAAPPGTYKPTASRGRYWTP